MRDGARRWVKADQLRQLPEQAEIAGAGSRAQHEMLRAQMCFHGGKKAFETGINHRRGGVVGADDIKAADLPLAEIGLKARQLLARHGDVKAERQKR